MQKKDASARSATVDSHVRQVSRPMLSNSRPKLKAPLTVVLSLALCTIALTGCEKALFTEKQPRTQFEQYDRTHGAYVPPTMTDRNGRERAALRERLRVPNG